MAQRQVGERPDHARPPPTKASKRGRIVTLRQAVPSGHGHDRLLAPHGNRSAIHRSSASEPPSAKSQLSAYDRISGTHRLATRISWIAAALALVLIAGIWIGIHQQEPGAQGSSAPQLPAAEAAEPGLDTSASIDTTQPPATDTIQPANPAELASNASAVASATAPDGIDASKNPVSYAASNVLDGDTSTAWRTVGNGHGVTLTITLPNSVHLVEVGLVPGYAKVDPANGVDRFSQNRRIEAVRWHFDDGTIVDQRFDDNPSMQREPVDVTTGSVTVEIASTRPGNPDHNYTPISEVSLIGG